MKTNSRWVLRVAVSAALFVAMLSVAAVYACGAPAANDEMADAFQSPPAESLPRCWRLWRRRHQMRPDWAGSTTSALTRDSRKKTAPRGTGGMSLFLLLLSDSLSPGICISVTG